MSEKITDVRCPVCHDGMVVESSVEKDRVPVELMVMGPGGENNCYTETAYYCSNEFCRVMFASLPRAPLQEQ